MAVESRLGTPTCSLEIRDEPRAIVPHKPARGWQAARLAVKGKARESNLMFGSAVVSEIARIILAGLVGPLAEAR